MMLLRVNIGCGQTPTDGWVNLDNSPALKLAHAPVRYFLARKSGLLNQEQINNIEWLRRNDIGYADAGKRLPFADNAAEVIYSSHMLEHLSQRDAAHFVHEAKRVLISTGVLRLVVPDLDISVRQYLADKDADRFMRDILVTAPPIDTWRDKIKLLATGYRHHQWMYNGDSLKNLLEQNGFSSVTLQTSGGTMIREPGALNLTEREEESVVVEAQA